MKLSEIIALFKALPSDTYRLGDADFDRKRAKFYAQCAEVFGFEGWQKKPKAYKAEGGTPGGNRQRREKYGEAAIHSYWNVGAGAVELFERQSKLLDSEIGTPYSDEKRDQAAFEGNQRRRVARKVRDLFEGSQISRLQSADLEAVPGGGFGPRSPSDHALDCQKAIHQMRKEIPPKCMRMIEAVIVRDEFLWEVANRKEAKRILQEIRMALDFACWSLGTEVRGRQEVTLVELQRRWPDAVEWEYQRKLRPAVHAGRVYRR